MANPYFRNLPNFDYVNRTSDGRNISDYTAVKNLFKKGKLREDIIENLTLFEKYTIIGDDRPDNVAYEVYGDATLDWVVLTSNNIINVYDEWPMSQQSFDTYLTQKYLFNYNLIYNGIHHYESKEVRNSQGVVIFPKGITVEATQTVSYYDYYDEKQVTIDVAVPITNYEYEEKLNNEKRNIFLLKNEYLNIVFDDLEEMMQYKEGSTQYVSETLKRADNIRLFQ
jgi:hypothetical protein